MRGWAVAVACGLLAGCFSVPSAAPPDYQQLGGERQDGMWWLPSAAVELRVAGEAWGAPRWFNQTSTLRLPDADSELDQAVRVEAMPATLALQARLAPDPVLSGYGAAWLVKPSLDPYFLDPAATFLATDESFAFGVPAVGDWTLKLYLLDHGQTVARLDWTFASATTLVVEGAAFPGDPAGGDGYDDVVVRLPEEASTLRAQARLRPGAVWQQGTDIDLRLLGDSTSSAHCSRREPSVPPGMQDANESVAWAAGQTGPHELVVRVGAVDQPCQGRAPAYRNAGPVPYVLTVLVS